MAMPLERVPVLESRGLAAMLSFIVQKIPDHGLFDFETAYLRRLFSPVG